MKPDFLIYSKMRVLRVTVGIWLESLSSNQIKLSSYPSEKDILWSFVVSHINLTLSKNNFAVIAEILVSCFESTLPTIKVRISNMDQSGRACFQFCNATFIAYEL